MIEFVSTAIIVIFGWIFVGLAFKHDQRRGLLKIREILEFFLKNLN